MISRYKKAGGFKQLLKLVETSGKTKQEKFLNIIREEDPSWATAIEKKMLTLEKILSWNDQVLAEVFSRLNDLTLGICSQLLTSEQWDLATKTFSHSKLRQIRDLYDGKSSSPAEQSTAIVNVLTEVRTMISDGMIRIEQVDESLVIEDDIEELLAVNGDAVAHKKDPDVDMSDVDKKLKDSGMSGAEDLKKEMAKLRKKIIVLGNENHTLRRENDELKKKFDQIRRLAS